jgi:hypothetical protein
MGKMVEVTLLSLTCEFAASDEGGLQLTGNFFLLGFDNPADIKTTKVIFDFPDGPIPLHKAETAPINRAERIAIRDPTFDPPVAGDLFFRFGGELVDKDVSPDTDDLLGSEWQTLGTTEVTQPEPRLWHLYFGRNNQVARADFTTRVAHPL